MSSSAWFCPKCRATNDPNVFWCETRECMGTNPAMAFSFIRPIEPMTFKQASSTRAITDKINEIIDRINVVIDRVNGTKS